MNIKYRSKRKGLEGKLYCADARKFLQRHQGVGADLIFLDPPFNLGKPYPGRSRKLDKVPDEKYAEQILQVLDAAIDVLAEGGALYLYHVPKWGLRFGGHLQSKLQFKHWIAVSMKNGFVRGRQLYPAHYALLYFTKGEAATFNRPKLEITRCRKCGETTKDYGGYLSIMEEKGVNLSDIWEDLSPVRHRSTKTRPANELPLAFYRRVFEISGVEDGLFIDPFVGSGASAIVAMEFGMNYTVNDISADSLQSSLNRLRNAELK
ncbi:MAG: site-specific DNA-methyltransferase [Planctomycetota bacterium]|nr:site-specific DNA-methyltransferase [Planctomycetota bacterium]